MRYQLRKSRAQEKRTAEEIGGRRTPGSGNQWHSKADVNAERVLVECKYTDGKSYTLKVADLLKLRTQAARVGKNPAFQIQFPQGRWAVISWDEYLGFLEEAAMLRGLRK